MSTDTYEVALPVPAVEAEGNEVNKQAYPPALPFPRRRSGNDEIVLPRWIYIQDRTGRYLSVRSSPVQALLTFQPGPPNLNNAFETNRRGPSRFTLLTNNGNHIMGVTDPNELWYSADHVPPDQVPTFTFIRARGNIVYLQDNYPLRLFMSSQLRSSGSPLGRNFINQDSEMDISIAAVRREIVDVHYNIPGGVVREAPPRIALSTSVRNDSSSSDATQTLEYSYEKWAVGTWNNAAGIEIGASTSFRAGIPFVFSARFEISVTAAFTHEWGGEEGVREVVTSSTSVVVPPRKRAHATVIVRNAQIDVGFTYTERVLWSNGQSQNTQRGGIYTNVDSWHVDVEISDWVDI